MTLRSELPDWLTVDGAYRAAGVTPYILLECLVEGYAYTDGKVALASDPEDLPGLALHDLAHFLVAPPERKFLPNFGLGIHPQVSEDKDAECLLADGIAMNEEGDASVVNVLLAGMLFGEKEEGRVREELNVGGDIARLYPHSVTRLQACGVMAADLSLILPRPLAGYIARNRRP